MRQHAFGVGIADAVRQARQRIEAVDSDLVTGGDLRTQAEISQPVERAVPEGYDVGAHRVFRQDIAFSNEVGTGPREENASDKRIAFSSEVEAGSREENASIKRVRPRRALS